MDLLIEIKRHASNSSSSSSSTAAVNSNSGGATGAGPTPNAVASNSNMTMMTPPMATSSSSSTSTNMPLPHHQQQKDVSRLNTEVKSLKKQMSSMVKNMEDLTSLVKGMNVSSLEEGDEEDFTSGGGFGVGNKRKKISLSPEAVPSSSSSSFATGVVGVGGGMMVNGEEDVVMMSSFPSVDDTLLEDSAAADLLLPDLTSSSSLMPSSYSSSPVLSRSSSLNGVATAAAASGGGDFVDELFNAFATEEGGQPSSQHQQQVMVMENPNKPDAALMKRIEDSLSTIPKTMHEMVANRLIDAIAEGNKDISACSSSSLSSISPNVAIKKEDASADVIPEAAGTSSSSTSSSPSTIPLPLAVATLKTILADYGLKVESCSSNSEDAMVHRRMSNKSLPLVPMHA